MSNDQTPYQIARPTLRACRVALTIIALLAGHASVEADELPQTQLPPANAAEMALGEQSELCRELQRGFSEWHMKTSDCGVPFPSGNHDFSLLQWQELDPAQHEELISDIFYWHNALASQEWDYGTFRRLQLSRRYLDVNQEMKSKVWGPAADFVHKAIAEGRIELQRARTEMIPDGKSFWLYRMTPVWLNRKANGEELVPPVVIPANRCARTDIPGSEPPYFYYAATDEDIYAHFYFRQHGHYGDVRYFVWRQQLFRYERGHVHYFHPKADPDQAGDFYLTWLCRGMH